MAKEVIEIVKCDRCGKKMEGPSRVSDKVDSDAPEVLPKFRLQRLSATGNDDGSLVLKATDYYDVCESCDVYVRKQLDYILLTRKRGRKPKDAPKAKRTRKPKATAAPTTTPFPSAPVNGGADPDVAKVVD
jgi:hypothetical protein